MAEKWKMSLTLACNISCLSKDECTSEISKGFEGKEGGNERGRRRTHSGEKVCLASGIASLEEDCSREDGDDSDSGSKKNGKRLCQSKSRVGEEKRRRDSPSELLHDLKPDHQPGSSLEVVGIS